MVTRASLCAWIALGLGWVACTTHGPAGGGATAGAGGTPIAVLCEDACAKTFPSGVETYEKLANCLVCGACHDACAAEGQVCGTADLGCSAMVSGCDACVKSPCALTQKSDTTFEGACAAEGTACAQSSDCVGLNNCVASCIVSTGPGGVGGAGGAGGNGGSG